MSIVLKIGTLEHHTHAVCCDGKERKINTCLRKGKHRSDRKGKGGGDIRGAVKKVCLADLFDLD